MLDIFNFKSPKYILKNDSLWLGRMLYLINSFEDEIVEKALDGDVESILKIFDLNCLFDHAISTKNEKIINFMSKFPGYEKSKRFSVKNQEQHLYILITIANIIAYKNRNKLDLSQYKSSYSIVFDIIREGNLSLNMKLAYDQILKS